MRVHPDSGFTLIELMFAVVVLGILVTVAVVAYTSNIRKAKSAEVVQMFGEFKMREDVYHSEHGVYVSVCPSPSSVTPVYETCAEDDYWPTPLPGRGQAMDVSSPPARWTLLRVNIPRSLYCQYEAIAGLAGNDTNIGATGLTLFPSAPPRNWYYLMARCDWDGEPSVKATYWQRDDLIELGKDNEGR